MHGQMSTLHTIEYFIWQFLLYGEIHSLLFFLDGELLLSRQQPLRRFFRDTILSQVEEKIVSGLVKSSSKLGSKTNHNQLNTSIPIRTVGMIFGERVRM